MAKAGNQAYPFLKIVHLVATNEQRDKDFGSSAHDMNPGMLENTLNEKD